jgi:hypothetical protein
MTQYDLVTKIYNDNQDRINRLIDKSKFKRTFGVLITFHSKIEDLKKGLESSESHGAFYSSQCLERILFEHFLVVFYIWNKARIEMIDDCASDYLDYYPMYEMIRFENANSKLDKSYDSSKTPLENFFNKAPEFKGDVSEEDFTDLTKKAKQFTVSDILDFMRDKLKANDPYEHLKGIILQDCKKYNRTSSYIHGGRLAEKQVFENTPPTDKKNVMKDNSKTAELYSHQTLSFIMLLLIEENPDFLPIYQPVLDLINKK